MLRRTLALSCACLLGNPALAQDPDARFQDFVLLLTGVAADATVNVGHGAVSRAVQLAPNSYEVQLDPTGATIRFDATEPQRCVLQLDVTIAGQPMGGGMRLDLNRVTGADIHPMSGDVPSHVLVTTGSPYTGPLNGIAVEIDEAGDALLASPDGLTFTPMTPHATFLTSLSAADVQAAFDALHAACPGP